jgi:hypothetical protein
MGGVSLGVMLGVMLVVGCSDSRVTAPDAQQGYITTAELKLRNPATGSLERVDPRQLPAGMSAAVVAGTTTVPAVVYSSTDAGVAPRAMSAVYTGTAVDSAGHSHAVKEVDFYKAGMPPSSMYGIVDGKLATITTFTWTRISNGWYLSKSVLTGYKSDGSALGTYTQMGQYTQTTTPCNPKVTPNCPPQGTALSPSQHVVKGLYAMLSTTSCTAWAKTPLCLREWALLASAWLGTIAGALTAETGVGLVAAASAYIATGVAAYDLMKCRHGAQPAGGGGGGPTGNDDCTNGMAQCTTIWVA